MLVKSGLSRVAGLQFCVLRSTPSTIANRNRKMIFKYKIVGPPTSLAPFSSKMQPYHGQRLPSGALLPTNSGRSSTDNDTGSQGAYHNLLQSQADIPSQRSSVDRSFSSRLPSQQPDNGFAFGRPASRENVSQ